MNQILRLKFLYGLILKLDLCNFIVASFLIASFIKNFHIMLLLISHKADLSSLYLSKKKRYFHVLWLY